MAGRVLCEDSLNSDSRVIDQLGSDPAQWITVLNDLEKVQNEYRKAKLLGCFFSRAHRHLNPRDLAKNESYAILLGREAMFHGSMSMDYARLKFESAVLTCRSPIIHVMHAQFELNCRNENKALEILCQAKLDFGDLPQIQTAIKKLTEGHSDICSDTIIGKKHRGVEQSMNTGIQQKERYTKDLSQGSIHNLSLHNLSISTPKLNKDGTARLLRRQKDLVSVIDECDNPHPIKALGPVSTSSQLNIDIGLQSPVAPDLSMLSKEFQPSNTLKLLETAKECNRKNNESSVLKSTENKRSESTHDTSHHAESGSISKKIGMPNLSSHKKLLQGPQRVLRVVKQDSDDDDSPKRQPRTPNYVEKDNAKLSSIEGIKSSGSKLRGQSIVSTPTLAVSQSKNALNLNQSSFSAFKGPMKSEMKATLDSKLDNNKENKLPQFLNVKAANPLEMNRSEISAHKADMPSVSDKPMQLCDGKVNVPLSLRGTDTPTHCQMKVSCTAAELVQDKKVLCVNNIWYLVLKMLGKGGSSKVYQAYDPKTSQTVAVKQVNLTDCDDQVLEGYKNEISFLESLQGSRYIVKLINYELKERCLYLVMECGSSDLSVFLKDLKASGTSLDLIDMKMLWKNMLRAVKEIHARGVIHLDLKPANFMFVNCNLKLIDFGIANSIQADATSVIKDTQFGTLNYMAPEMINDMSGGVQCGSSYQPKFKVGPKADVWSLGCILYYIMYGKTPFQHIHHQAMKLFAITNENHKIDFPSFPNHNFVEVVQVCLVRDPKKRPTVEMLLNHPILH